MGYLSWFLGVLVSFMLWIVSVKDDEIIVDTELSSREVWNAHSLYRDVMVTVYEIRYPRLAFVHYPTFTGPFYVRKDKVRASICHIAGSFDNSTLTVSMLIRTTENGVRYKVSLSGYSELGLSGYARPESVHGL